MFPSNLDCPSSVFENGNLPTFLRQIGNSISERRSIILSLHPIKICNNRFGCAVEDPHSETGNTSSMKQLFHIEAC